MAWLLLSCTPGCLAMSSLSVDEETADTTSSRCLVCDLLLNPPVTPVILEFQQLGSDSNTPAWLATHASQRSLPHCLPPPTSTPHHTTQHQHTAYLYTCNTPARASQSCKQQRQQHKSQSAACCGSRHKGSNSPVREAHLVRACPYSQATTPAAPYNDVIVDVGVQEERQLLAVTA
jgi:hypothetical protein